MKKALLLLLLAVVLAFAAGIAPANAEESVTEKPVDPLAGQLTHFSTMLVVSDIERSEAFYSKYFGLENVQHLEHLRLLQRPGVSLYLVTESAPTADKPTVTLAPQVEGDRTPVNLIFHVSDVRATHAALEEQGLKFLTPPQQPAWGGWRVFALDPDGYLIEIEQPE